MTHAVLEHVEKMIFFWQGVPSFPRYPGKQKVICPGFKLTSPGTLETDEVGVDSAEFDGPII